MKDNIFSLFSKESFLIVAIVSIIATITLFLIQNKADAYDNFNKCNVYYPAKETITNYYFEDVRLIIDMHGNDVYYKSYALMLPTYRNYAIKFIASNKIKDKAVLHCISN